MTDFSTPAPEIPRDRFGRPLVVPPGGGPRVGYTRCTTFVGAIEDPHNITKWKERHVALGLAMRPDLRDAVAATAPTEKGALNGLAEQAKEAAGASDAALIGTYLHKLTEAADLGRDTTLVPFPDLALRRDPAEFLPDVAAYLEATSVLKHRLVEQFGVHDGWQIGGTPDRVVEYQGKRYIADLKTGSVDWGYLKIAAQLAVYARSQPYDVATDQRLEPHGADTTRGIVIHLPEGTGTCRLLWVDLTVGWEAARACREVRELRKRRRGDVLTSLDVPAVPVTNGEPLVTWPAPDPEPTLADRLRATRSRDEALALWHDNVARWTPDLTDLAKAHIASLA